MTTDKRRTMQIRLINMAKAQVPGMDDDATYRATLAHLCNGKTSSKELTHVEADRVIEYMKSKGFVIKPKDGKPARPAYQPKAPVSLGDREPQMDKLRAIWRAMAEAGQVQERDPAKFDQAIERWAKSRIKTLTAIRFASSSQMGYLIEQLKQWAKRVGVVLA
jgi:phage gp16-like protein